MVEFRAFTPSTAIPPETIAEFADRAPAGAAQMWRQYGAGAVGDDGFVRVIDPARGRQMLAGSLPLPESAVPMFTTGLGDVLMWTGSMFLLFTFRWGTLRFTPEGFTLDELTALLEDEPTLDRELQRQPYPAAVARDGVPAHEECFGFVPLLALGGPNEASNLQRMGLYEHIALITQMAGSPKPVGFLFAGDK
ncbi:T6SS immunity protein Tdi1 domain-containing protein [Ruania zhangjianzhongii]|uniref:T6SS immunity protein Tdi1 domain-containing protein n=1 Tax=Ruania zhangjianzhongii TaxID=2603206 RepID=UPI0011C770A8|nr:T6SS immunity protein Tdi1 domain-containing protein [Ruania zhangjianzhongii]